MSKHFELERKFLLKNCTTEFYQRADNRLISMAAFYITEKGKMPYRIRFEKTDGEINIIKTTKQTIALGNREVEENIEESEFISKIPYIASYIDKTRLIVKEDELEWEVDVYHNIKLITAEIEFLETNYNMVPSTLEKLEKVELPDIIKDQLILEVTELKEFSNANLAIPFKKFSDITSLDLAYLQKFNMKP